MSTRESLNLRGYDDSFSQMPSADIVSSVSFNEMTQRKRR